MKMRVSQKIQESSTANRLVLGLAFLCLFCLTPFSVIDFLHGRYFLGVGSFGIVLILVLRAWVIIRYDRDYPLIALFGLVPFILIFLFRSLQMQGIIGIFWCYPAVISFYMMLPERQAWAANAALLCLIVPYVLNSIDDSLAVRAVVTLFMVSILSLLFMRVITEQQEELFVKVVTDPLTGALNRTSLQESLETAIEQSNRSEVPMTLVALDIDHFKRINDTLGHDAGDVVLKNLTDLLIERCRCVDKVFRIGGEEFLVLLYNTGLENGAQVAEELRASIAAASLLPERKVTVSIGVAALCADENWDQWMKRSDHNLYQAKSDGRNTVVACPTDKLKCGNRSPSL